MKALMLVAVVVLVATGCAGRSDTASTPLPPDPPTARVQMREYSFVTRPAMPPGRVVFDVRNAGRRDHELSVVRLPADMAGTIDSQLRSADRRAFPTVVALAARAPGSTSTFALDLAPGGRYAMVCLLRDEDGVEHALKGMSAELVVGRSPEVGA